MVNQFHPCLIENQKFHQKLLKLVDLETLPYLFRFLLNVHNWDGSVDVQVSFMSSYKDLLLGKTIQESSIVTACVPIIYFMSLNKVVEYINTNVDFYTNNLVLTSISFLGIKVDLSEQGGIKHDVYPGIN